MRYSIPLLSLMLFSGASWGNCPDVPGWAKQNGLNGSFDAECNFTVDGITFRNDENLWGVTLEGSKSPSYSWNDQVKKDCQLENVIYNNVVRQNANEGHDLMNPSMESHIRHFVIKDSVLRGTRHVNGGHEDILQPYRALSDGGWLVIQDSVAKDADENMFMNVGTAQEGYGNGPGDEFRCDDKVMPPGSTPGVYGSGGVLFQGLTLDRNASGYNGYNQIDIGGPGPALPEVWLVETHYNYGIGINFYDTVGKVVVVGGSGGTKGWPGPLKARRTNGDKMTEASCPAGGWDSQTQTCCPNGRVNVKGQVFSWQSSNGAGDDPKNGAIPIYCYDSIENALRDGHKAPPFLDWSKTGWAKPGETPVRDKDETGSDGEGGELPGAGDGETSDGDVAKEAPTLSISPEGGTLINPVAVTIESDLDDTTIYYTLDGSTPTEQSEIYQGSIVISEPAELNALAVTDAGARSDVYSAEYVFDSFRVQSEWGNIGLEEGGEKVYLSYTYNPNESGQDVVIGLSAKEVGRFPELVANVRFSPEGLIDSRNGDDYSADVSMDYVGGGFYQVDMVADVAKSQYSVFVMPFGGERVQIAKDFEFRTGQLDVTQLANVAFIGVDGTGMISNVNVSFEGYKPEAPKIKGFMIR